MTGRFLFGLLALLAVAVATPALAQDSGGVGITSGLLQHGGPRGLARPLPYTQPPYITAQQAQGGMSPADHQAQNQATITKLRGDAGFLAGFSMGTPLAASRQPAVAVPAAMPDDGGYRYRHSHGGRGDGIVINNVGPLALTVGDGNVVQQQSATSLGPVAQQQVATTPSGGPTRASGGGGAVNLVTGGGNIVQRAPQ
jgi:hypothetical protein